MNEVLTRFGQAKPIAYLQAADESAVPAVRRRKPLPHRSPEAAFERERIVGDQPVQISKSTARSSFNSFGSTALPSGVLFTTFNPMMTAQSEEGM
jgi:hypothetical protein